MINVSNEFWETMEERTDFMEAATITFTNGDVLELSGDDFTLTNNSLSDSAGTSNFPLGVALEKVIQIELFNEDDHLWDYDFYGAEIRLKLTFQLSNSVETVDYGTYTVITPETYGTTVIINAADEMYLADKDYETNLEFPCTLREIVQDSCHTTGIYLLTTTFRNDDFEVQEKPEGLTHRQVIAMAAMIACGYARMNYKGELVITSYDISMFDTTDGLDDGYFDTGGSDACAAFNVPSPSYGVALYTNSQTFAAGTYNVEIELAKDSNVSTEAEIRYGFSTSSSFTSSTGTTIGVEELSTSWVKYSTEITLSASRSYFTIRNTTVSSGDGYVVYIRNLVITDTATGEVVLEESFTDGEKPSDWTTSVGSTRNSVTFNTAEPYTSGDTADGGSFNPWNTGDEVSGGSFEDMSTYHSLYNFSANGLRLETDDVVITGIQAENEDEEVFLAGEEGYILELDNDLIKGKEEEAVSLIAAALVGFRFRPFEGDHIAYPVAEYGDVAVIQDRKGRAYQTVLTDIDFTFRGFTVFKCSAESPLRNSASYAASSDYVKAVIAARKNTEEQLSEYDKQMQKLADLMANSLGVYETEEVLEDGSVIYYLHDKPTIDESTTIWKMAADGFAVSTDGGKTWNAGITSDGNLIANVLSVIGINWDWAHGGTLTLGNYNNEDGWMKVLDANGVQIGVWDKDGISIQKGTIAIGGKFSVGTDGILYSEGGEFSGTVTCNKGLIGNWVITDSEIKSSENMGNEDVAGLRLANKSSESYLTANDGNDNLFEITRQGIATGMLVDCSIQSGSTINTEIWLSNHDDRSNALLTNSVLAYSDQTGSWESDGLNVAGTIINASGMRLVSSNTLDFYRYGSRVGRIYANTSSRLVVSGNTNTSTFSVTNALMRLSETEDYGDIATQAYTMMAPYYGDLGFGYTDENGLCYVLIDAIFAEMIDQTAEYHVFLQKEGAGDIWIKEKTKDYFVVEGTPDLKFSWEVKAIQNGYSTVYAETDENTDLMETDFDAMLEADLDEYDREVEGFFNGSY